MNEFGISIVWLALQVSVLCLVTALLYVVFRRGNPRTRGVLMQSSLLLVVPLSIVAFVPWPSWLDQSKPHTSAAGAGAESNSSESTSTIVTTESTEPVTDKSRSAIGVLDTTANFFRNFGEELRTQPTSQTDGQSATGSVWKNWLAIGFLTALAIGCLRMISGAIAVNRYGRRAQLVNDLSIRETFDILVAEFSCNRMIELRESSEIVSAATIGWRRPVILLPSDWRTWSEDEQRSVLAHEIAHIVHNDFFNWLCAQIAVLLHFYHPLMHWLAGRLRLEQELAADAAAAQYSGGANVYLKNLAGLAVRQNDQSIAWPARTFLPWKGTLIRRIEMLRDSKSGRRYPTRWGRGSFVLVMLVAAIVLSGLRQPAQQAVAQQVVQGTAQATVDTQPVGKLTAANFGFVPKDSVVVVSMRPAALAKIKGIDKVADLMQQTFDQGNTSINVRELDQVTMLMFPGTRGKRPVSEPLIVLESKTKGALSKFMESAKGDVRKYQGEEYKPQAELRREFFYAPNENTVAIGGEESVKHLIDSIKQETVSPTWTMELKQAASNHLIYYIDMESLRPEINRGLQGPAAAMMGAFSPLWDDADDLIGSLAIGESSSLSIQAICSTKAGAKKVKATVDSLIPLGKNALEQTRVAFTRETDVPPEGKLALKMAQDILDNLKVTSKAKTATVSVEIGDNGVPALTALLLPAIQSAREAARRTQAMNNLKQLMIALHNYYDTHKEFPKPVMTGPDGKTKYSWRVAILPFIEHQELYKQYNRNEPWDSDNNKKVLAKIPPVYRNPNAPAKTTFSSYLALTGKATGLGDSENGIKFRDILDGTSNTVMLVEVQRKIPWTKPADISFDPKGKMPELKGFHKGGFHVGIGDGSVRFIANSIDEKILKALFTRNGGEVIDAF